MIVRLVRPSETVDLNAPWLLYAPGLVDGIRPTPELARMLETGSGYFEAEELDGGWDIKGRAPDPGWI